MKFSSILPLSISDFPDRTFESTIVRRCPSSSSSWLQPKPVSFLKTISPGSSSHHTSPESILPSGYPATVCSSRYLFPMLVCFPAVSLIPPALISVHSMRYVSQDRFAAAAGPVFAYCIMCSAPSTSTCMSAVSPRLSSNFMDACMGLNMTDAWVWPLKFDIIQL